MAANYYQGHPGGLPDGTQPSSFVSQPPASFSQYSNPGIQMQPGISDPSTQPQSFQQPIYGGPPQSYNASYPGQQGYGQAAPPPDQFAIPGLNAPAMNPLNLMAAGSSFLSGNATGWGQQYVKSVQQRVGWLTGGAFSYHFAVNSHYVRTKLLMLLAPFLKKWNFARQPEQIQGGQKYRPPKVDVAAPDLYIPLVSAWAYLLLVGLAALLRGKYNPDMMYGTAWHTAVGWSVQCLAISLTLRTMGMSGVLSWGELFSYGGYAFVPACLTIAGGLVGGTWAWRCMWVYGSLCSSVFLVRTMKRLVLQEARGYGPNLTLFNYLLLGLAMFQFPFLLWLASVQLPAGGLLGTLGVAGAAAGSAATAAKAAGAAAGAAKMAAGAVKAGAAAAGGEGLPDDE